MTSRSDKPSPVRVIREDSAELPELDALTGEPDDQGLSLEELGEAYAALLVKGADPYSQPPEVRPTEGVPVDGTATEEDAAAEAFRGPGDDAGDCELTPKSILEAILFVGHPHGEPLTSRQISSLMRGVMPSEVDDLVQELNEAYDSQGAAYRINPVSAGYRLQLREEFGALRDKFLGRLREARLSQAAIDILSIVAYKQPITADEIDRWRSKPSSALLAQLVRRDLLQIERIRGKGRKALYRTTDRFLDLFGLDSLADLPRSQEAERAIK